MLSFFVSFALFLLFYVYHKCFFYCCGASKVCLRGLVLARAFVCALYFTAGSFLAVLCLASFGG